MLSERTEDRLLTAREAAALLRASRAKLYRLVKAGQLPAYKVGGTYVFYAVDLHAYVRGTLFPATQSSPATLVPPTSVEL